MATTSSGARCGDADNIVWGTSTVDEGGVEETVLYDDPNSAPPNFNNTSFEALLEDTMSLLTNSTAIVVGTGSTTTGGR